MCKRFKENVLIISSECIGKDIYSLWIESKDMAAHAKPGQFLDLYVPDTGKLLPRPISICEIDYDLGRIRMVYRVTGSNTGTQLIANMKSGETLQVVGPLGNGFPLINKKAILIGGGIGVPPMLELAKQLDCEKQIVVGYREDLFLLEELKAQGEVYIATEDGSAGTKGNVLDAIRENTLDADVIFSCGPTPMLRAIKEYALEHNIECYISLEEKMACGIGACLACVCKTTEVNSKYNTNTTRICKDGPVFLSTEVEL